MSISTNTRSRSEQTLLWARVPYFRHRVRWVHLAAGLAMGATIATAQFGCPSAAAPFAGDGLGVTAGGAENMAQARAVILSGGVPEPDSITVEGMLSEHDIPLTAPDEAEEFYAYTGLAWRVPFGSTTGAAGADIILGIGTTIDLETFEREPQNLVVLVDRSGSMNHKASSTDSRTKFQAVKDAMLSLADQLDETDRLTIVSFAAGARVELETTAGDRRDEIEDAINHFFTIRPDGATDLSAGLTLAFSEASSSAGSTRANRVIVFTDANPTVGDTDADDLVELVSAQASLNIGFTLMGVGESFGTELAVEMAQVSGANFFYLEDEDRIEGIFEEDFDFMVTPAAYDMIVDVIVPEGIGIRDVYGVPDYTPGANGAQIVVPTLFFSRREGSGVVIIRLTLADMPTEGVEHPLASASLSYRLLDGTERFSEFEITLPTEASPTGETAYYSDESTRRAALLLDTALVLHDAAADALGGRGFEGIGLLDLFLPYFDEMSLGMSDRTDPSSRGLSDERELIETMRETIDDGRYLYN